MGLKRSFLYIVLAGLVIVSFQNCGQPGSLGIQSQEELGKVVSIADAGDAVSDVQAPGESDIISVPDDVTEVESPVVPPNGGSQGPKDDKDSTETDDDADDIVDADEEGNIQGPQISCTDLVKFKFSFIKNSNKSEFKNTKGSIKVDNRDEVSIEKHRGLVVLSNINVVSKLENIRSLLMRVQANSVTSMENIRALSLIDAPEIGSVSNYRGLGCMDGSIDSVENFRGILEVKGNLKSVKNFRGILKVVGDVDSIENFRGLLVVTGTIKSQNNVKLKLK